MVNELSKFSLCVPLLSILFTIGCSAQTEEQALASLRVMTRGGKLPPEAPVASVESRFAGKKAGALAKLLRARIRFENGDYAGAAALLESDVFQKRTRLADHAMWLRGRALQSTGRHAEVVRVLEQVMREHPASVRLRDAKLLWAASAIQIGRAAEVPPMLVDLSEKNDPDALLATAKAYEAQGSKIEAIKYYRRTAFNAAGSPAAEEAGKKLRLADPDFRAESDEEWLAMANAAYASKRYADAALAYRYIHEVARSPLTSQVQLKYLTALANTGKVSEAQAIFNSMQLPAPEREEGYRQLILAYAKARQWPRVRSAADEMRQKYPGGNLVAKTLVDAGIAARDAKNIGEARYYFDTAVAAYPNAVEVAQAQFESAWLQHESKNYAASSQMLIDHLARYAGRDTTNRGKAGYWAARDSERAGKTDDACSLYEAVNYRYGANWYGYLAQQRLSAMKVQGRCGGTDNRGIVTIPAAHSPLANAIANLRTVTVAAETAREREIERVEKSEELSIVGLFDWAVDELNEAKKTANTSPKINLALAQHYTLKGDRVNALLSLGKSYPDYAQMFPEEMGREEWAIFYPLTNWNEITHWARTRGLDRYQVAGVIRQETIFDPRAESHADAYGLMQLLLPTAKSMARKYSASLMPTTGADLFQPSLNIELGTAYMKDQFDKFGRFEFVGIAYNAGPGRVAPWRAQLPVEMDEFVEAIPFKETRGYVQGIIRNSAQYRRLYDGNGNFLPSVGSRPLRGEIDTKSRDTLASEFPELIVDEKGIPE